MIKITKFFYVHILLLPMIFVAFVTKTQMTFFIMYATVLIHELCHLLMALILGVKVHSIIVMPFGMTVRIDSNVFKTPKKEVLIALAGPVSNFIMLLCSYFFNYATENYYLFIVINLSLILINLVPIPPLDGGRILRAIVIKNVGLIPSAKIMRKVSAVFITLLLVLWAYLLIFFKGNMSLFVICAFLLYSLSDEKKNSDILIMREIIYEKEKLKQDALIPCKMLCVHKNTPVRRVLRKLNLSTFYIITIVDDDLKILRTVTESDFISTATSAGYRATSNLVGLKENQKA